MARQLGASWDGSLVKPIQLAEIRSDPYVYWQVKINGRKYWVIRRFIKDLRPVIADELKPYFGLNKCGTHYFKKGKLYVLLIRSRDPHLSPELTLNRYIANPELITDYMREQVQLIYTFRRMTGMSKNINNSLIIRRVGYDLRIYSLYDTFPLNDSKAADIPDAVLNRWFEFDGVEFYDTLADMLGTPRPNNDDPDDLFGQALHRLNMHLESLIARVDIDLIWYQSDIINYIIGKVTPR